MKTLGFGFVCLVIACSTTATTTGGDPDGDAGSAPDVIDIDVGDESVTAIDMSPFALVPPFSPSIHDYYVRCASGENLGTLSVTLSSGDAWQSPFDLVEDQAVVVANTYWIRCLPHDFPELIVARHGTPTPGLYLLNAPAFAMVLDTNGTPVWYARGPSVLNVDALAVNDISFAPNATAPFGWDPDSRFDIHALDVSDTTSVVANGTPTDAHELRLLPNGDHLLFTYPIETVDLTGLAKFGSNERMADCEVQEIDASGKLVWSWRASDHIDPIRESLEPAVSSIDGQQVVDVFHCNSIEVGTSGDWLVSFRHENAVYDIDRASGVVRWKLGGSPYGKDGEERLAVTNDPLGTFYLQHDARFQPNGDVTMFDDHGASPGVARGVEYALDHVAHTASLVFHFDGIAQASYEGSFRRYADGHSVIGWGYVPADARVLTEIDEAGNDVLDVSFEGGTYRAVKVPLSQLDIALLRTTAGK